MEILKILFFIFINNYIFSDITINVDIYGSYFGVESFTFNTIEMKKTDKFNENGEEKYKPKYQNNLQYFFEKFNNGKLTEQIDEDNYVFVNKSDFFDDNNNLRPEKNNGTFIFRKKQYITFTFYDGLKEKYKSNIPTNLNYIIKKQDFLNHLRNKLNLNTIYIIKNSNNQYKKIKDIEEMSEDEFRIFILNSSSFELIFKHECYDKCTYKVVFYHNEDIVFDIVNDKRLDLNYSNNKELVSCEFECDPNGYKNISCTCDEEKTINCNCNHNIFYYTFSKLFDKQEIKQDGDKFMMTEDLNINNFLTYASFCSHIFSITFCLRDRYSDEIIEFIRLNNNGYDYKLKNRKYEEGREIINGKSKITDINIFDGFSFEILVENLFDTNITIDVILNGNIEKKKYNANICTSDNKYLNQEIEYFDMSKSNGSILELISYLVKSKLIPKYSAEYYVDENGKIKSIKDQLQKLMYKNNLSIVKPYNDNVCGVFLQGCTSKQLMDHINANSKYLNGLSINNSNFEALSCCIFCMKCCACCCCCSKTCCNPIKGKKNKNNFLGKKRNRS